jgi:hypothetical protein
VVGGGGVGGSGGWGLFQDRFVRRVFMDKISLDYVGSTCPSTAKHPTGTHSWRLSR